MSDGVRITAADGRTMEALFSAPARRAAPGVVVLHEIFGMTPFVRTRLPLLNDRGYVAMAPDLYHRVAPGAVFGYAGDDWERAFAARNSLDDDLAATDVGSAIGALRQHPACDGRVAVVGYCLGGLLAFLAAARSDADAFVCFHGVRLEQHLDEAPGISRPLQMHFAGRDRWAPPEVVRLIKDALPAHAECHDYPEADHGFSRDGQPVFDTAATAKAHAVLFAFLSQHLNGEPS